MNGEIGKKKLMKVNVMKYGVEGEGRGNIEMES